MGDPIETYFRGIGASNHTEDDREVNDYYATNPIAIDCLLEKATLDHNIWECACGAGHLVKRLTELGYNVKATDLIDRGLGGGVQTSCSRMNTGMETFLLIHLTSMHKNLLNTL